MTTLMLYIMPFFMVNAAISVNFLSISVLSAQLYNNFKFKYFHTRQILIKSIVQDSPF